MSHVLSSSPPAAALAACRSSDDIQTVYSNVSYIQLYSATVSGWTPSSLFLQSTAICVASGLHCTTNIKTFCRQFMFYCGTYCMVLFIGRISLHSHLKPNSIIMATLWNRAGHDIFALWFLSFFFFLLLFSSPNLSGRWRCGLSANLECRSEMCCTWLAENTGCKKVTKNRHRGTIAQLCRAISPQLRHISTIGKTC